MQTSAKCMISKPIAAGATKQMIATKCHAESMFKLACYFHT